MARPEPAWSYGRGLLEKAASHGVHAEVELPTLLLGSQERRRSNWGLRDMKTSPGTVRFEPSDAKAAQAVNTSLISLIAEAMAQAAPQTLVPLAPAAAPGPQAAQAVPARPERAQEMTPPEALGSGLFRAPPGLELPRAPRFPPGTWDAPRIPGEALDGPNVLSTTPDLASELPLAFSQLLLSQHIRRQQEVVLQLLHQHQRQPAWCAPDDGKTPLFAPAQATQAVYSAQAAQEGQKFRREKRVACKFVFQGIDMMADADFELVPRLIGRGGSNTRSISEACNGKVRIRGRGSGHKEQHKNSRAFEEADVPLQMVLSCQDQQSLETGKALILKFLATVQGHFERYCRKKGTDPVPELFVVVDGV